MLAELEAQGDPRVLGHAEQLESYEYAGEATRGFYERYTAGEDMDAGWVNESDFEKEPIEDYR